MAPENFFGVVLDICPSCAGIWFDSDELKRLLHTGPPALTELEEKALPRIDTRATGDSTHVCPDCHTRLQENHYAYSSPVILHSCDKCGGFWIADGDLVTLREWYEKALQPPTAEEQAGIGLGSIVGESMRSLERQRNVLAVSQAMRHNMPGWFGLA